MRALILLHGALGSSAQFGPLCQLLEGRAKCYCPEFPGHGITPVSGEFSVAAFARKLLEFRNGIPEREVAIFGYSMGGYVALKAASGISGLVSRSLSSFSFFQGIFISIFSEFGLSRKFHW